MLRKKLEGKKIGVVFGTFAPLHTGHMTLIHQAKKEQEGVIVIVSGYKGDRGEQVSLPLDKRFNKARITFEGDDLVEVRYIDESNMERYPDGWADWLDGIDGVLSQSTLTPDEATYTFYVGEADYAEEFAIRRPQYNVKLADRALLPISGTQIRNNPLPHFESIAAPFRGTFSQNYLVVGAASTGKTTLLKIINGLLVPSSGSITIGGEAPGVITKQHISYLPDTSYFPKWMKITDLFTYFNDFYADFDEAKAREMLRRLNINEKRI